MPPFDGNSWDEWRNHILKELERHNESTEAIFTKLNRLAEDISALKVKAGIWGAVGGAIPVAIAFGIYFLTKGH